MQPILKKHAALLINSTTLLLIIFIYYSGSRYQFLITNLGLALIPFNLSLMARRLPHKYLQIPLALIWLIFYPNTTYMLTDFSHLSSIGTGLATPFQYYNYSILTGSIILAVIIGLISMEIIVNVLVKNVLLKTLSYTILSFISAFAIYIGRFMRLNSSDLLLNPSRTLQVILSANERDLLIFVFCFALLQLFLIFIFKLAVDYATTNLNEVN